MEWENTSEESQLMQFDPEETPSTSNALIERDVMSGPGSLTGEEGGGNIFKRVNVKHSSGVKIGCTSNFYYGTVTQIVQPSKQPALENISSNQNESSNVITDDELLKNVPYLCSLYSTENAYMSSLLWDDDERDYSLKDYFINLKLDEEDLLGKFKKRQDIPLESIFLPDKGERKPSRILITGNPGYGKSTICSKLAYDWAILEPPHYLSHFDILIVISLCQLGERTLEDVVVDVIADEETDIEKLKKYLCKSKHQFLILLDGLDEATDTTNIEKSLKPHKNSIRFPEKTTIVLTSRSHAAKPVRKLFHRHLCVNGFNDEKQKEYIERFFFANHHSQTSICKLLLSEESVIKEFAQCPLMLHMMCCLHEEIDLSALKRVTDMYLQVFRLFFTRYESKYDYHPLLQEGKYIKGECFLLKLGKMSFDILCGKLSEIREKELTNVFNQHDEFEMLLKLGLLKTSRTYSRGKIIITFEILHRAFVEFLAAFYFYFEFHILQNSNCNMIGELLDHAICENFLICVAGLFKEKFHLIINGEESEKFYDWDVGLCARLLKESGHTKENMEACRQWLQRIDIDTSMYEHGDVDATLPLALRTKNSVTERITFQFSPLEEYIDGRYYVISPKLLQAMKDCKTLLFIEVCIRFEVLEKDGDKIAWVDLTACFAFLNKLLQMPKKVHISVVLFNEITFNSYAVGELVEETGNYEPVLMELVDEDHELLKEEKLIICMSQPSGAIVKFMVFPEEDLPLKLFLGIPRLDFYDFTDNAMFKHIVEILKSRDICLEIYLSEPEDMNSFDAKVYPLDT